MDPVQHCAPGDAHAGAPKPHPMQTWPEREHDGDPQQPSAMIPIPPQPSWSLPPGLMPASNGFVPPNGDPPSPQMPEAGSQHTPSKHIDSFDAQTWPHEPQFIASICTLTQLSPHIVPCWPDCAASWHSTPPTMWLTALSLCAGSGHLLQ
jgi:hypothetical protein